MELDPALHIFEEPLSRKYDIVRVIGEGSFGRAVLATRKETAEEVVVKQIMISELNPNEREEALKEVRLLSRFDHINIIHYFECIVEDGCLNIVMEYAQHGDLGQLIQNRISEKKPFSEDDVMFWFVQIILAVWQVHNKSMLHRDLKSSNIFIADGNILKLGDFGIARVLTSDTELAHTVIGTPYYLSPEICEDRPYSRKSDVWALGCVLYELLTLRRAFDGGSLPALVVKILGGKYPPIPTRYSSSLRNLVHSMLRLNPRERPSVDAILSLSFVRNHVTRYADHVVTMMDGVPVAQVVPEAKKKPPVPTAASARPAAHGGVTPGKPRKSSNLGVAGAPASEVDHGPEASRSSPPGSPTAHHSPGRPARGGSGGVHASQESGGDGNGERHASPGRKLVGDTWVANQNAAMAEISAALAAQRPKDDPATPITPQQRLAGRGSGGAAPKVTAHQTPLSSNTGVASPAGTGGIRGRNLELKQMKDAALEANKNAVAAERERRRVAATKRSQESAANVRARITQRRAEMEAALMRQDPEEEKRQKAKEELAAHIREKEDQKRRAAQEAAQQVSAHRKAVKGARPHISKAQLKEIGDQFGARQVVADSPGLLLVDMTLSPPNPVTRAPHLPSERTPFVAMGGAGAGLSASRTIHSASRSRPGSNPGNTLPRTPTPPSSDPPWRRKGGKVGVSRAFPDIQIFCASPSRPIAVEAHALASAVRRERENKDLLGVLTQIQDVLEATGDDDDGSAEDEAPPPAPAGPGRPAVAPASSRQASQREPKTPPNKPSLARYRISSLHLPPEAEEEAAAHQPPVTPLSSGSTPGNLPPSSPAMVNAGKVEQLRMQLEAELGPETFLKAYRYLHSVAEAPDDDHVDTQAALSKILGTHIHLVRHIHKLIKLENTVFN